MRRSSRLFEIIQLLRAATGPTTAGALAATLEVTVRTVYRDIVSLQAMRVPIEGAAGVGYVMRKGYDLPPLMFTAEELEAIAVGLSLLGRTGDSGLEAAARCAAGKIAEVVPKETGGLGSLPLHVSRWTAVPEAGVDHRMLREAIRAERELVFRYGGGETPGTERTVRPLALVYYVDSTVLAAWCRLRADFRHFRLDRIEACRLGEGGFEGDGERLRAAWSVGRTVP